MLRIGKKGSFDINNREKLPFPACANVATAATATTAMALKVQLDAPSPQFFTLFLIPFCSHSFWCSLAFSLHFLIFGMENKCDGVRKEVFILMWDFWFCFIPQTNAIRFISIWFHVFLCRFLNQRKSQKNKMLLKTNKEFC